MLLKVDVNSVGFVGFPPHSLHLTKCLPCRQANKCNIAKIIRPDFMAGRADSVEVADRSHPFPSWPYGDPGWRDSTQNLDAGCWQSRRLARWGVVS